MVSFSLYSLQSNPYISFIVPFVLVFAILYAGLKATNVFHGNNLNAIIAASIALFAVAYSPLNRFLWQTMPFIAGGILLLSLALVFFRMGKRLIGDETGKGWDKYFAGVNIAVLLILLSTYQNNIQLSWIDAEQVMWAVAIGAVLVVIAKAASQTEQEMESGTGRKV